MRTATRLILGLAVLLFCTQADAAVYYHIHVPLQDTYGSAMSGVTYYILDAGTADTSAVYSDRAGTRYYQGSERLTTDAGGMFDCYVLAGCYRIAFEDDTRWGDIADTLENYCYGVADSVSGSPTLTLLTVTGETELGDAVGDTFDIKGHILINNNNDIYRDWAGDVLWFKETSGTRRLGTESDRILGIGGTFQFEEDGGVNFARAITDTIDGTGDFDTYDDRRALGFKEDTGKAYIWQTLQLHNTLGYADRWKWGGYVGDYGGDYGVAPYAIDIRADLPDSNGATGYRELCRLTWHIPDDANCPRNQILNENSILFHIYEDGATDASHYKLMVGGLYLYPDVNDNEKKIQINTDTSGQYFLISTSPTASSLRVANQTLNIRDDDNSDDATVDCANVVVTDMFKFPVISLASAWPTDIGAGSAFMSTGDTLYIRNNADDAWNSWTKD